MTIRVLLADDHRVMRAGLRSLIDKEEDMEVVAQADNGRRAVELARECCPDVVMMDIGMRELNGIDATRQITATSGNIKVLALSMHGDEQFVAQMLAAGASGYLLKDCAFDELSQAIRAVVADQNYLSPSISRILIQDHVGRLSGDDLSDASALDNREREILQLLAEGKTSRQIASCLRMSVRTIETRRREIMAKLNLHSVAGLTKYAVRKGLTHL
ncbi:MAG: response regulator transcription factor [Thermodesulfobacteriota bacterium]|nr:response regulator transcription factor [Thermodesulfobacteriota bacterium]